MTEIKIYVACKNCGEGMHEKEFKELETNSDGASILVDKIAVTFVSYELTPEQLESQTIAEFVDQKACRKCRSKALKELIK